MSHNVALFIAYVMCHITFLCIFVCFFLYGIQQKTYELFNKKYSKMKNTKKALIEAKKIIDWHLGNIDEEQSEESLKSIKHFIKGLKVECQCDAYNGFDCGCSYREKLIEEALKEIEK